MCCDIDGFNSYHAVRINNRVGGGVSVYVRSSLQSNILPDFTLVEENGEIGAVEVIPDKGNPKCTVLGIYRPPDVSLLSSFTDRQEALLLNFRESSVTVCGDFNVDLLSEYSNQNFFNVFQSLNFVPIINIATRIKDSSATCLDQIWHNKLNISHSGAIVSDITDHYPVFVAINIVKNNDVISTIFRDHSKSNIDKLILDVNLMSDKYFTEIIVDVTVEEKCS